MSMLGGKVIEEIRELLEDGVPQRDVVRRLGVSRNAVARIARVLRTSPPEVPPAEEPAPVYMRCKGCGGLVQPPCRLCAIRRVQRRQRLRRRGVRLLLASANLVRACAQREAAHAACRPPKAAPCQPIDADAPPGDSSIAGSTATRATSEKESPS